MSKQILYGQEARDKLKAGIDKLANAVTTTLSPKGRNVAMKKWSGTQVVHDGVTVAREVELPDVFENMGADLIRQASAVTNDDAGDGTTTAALLAQSLVEESLQLVSAGVNPMSLKRERESASELVIQAVKETATPIETEEEMAQVATISAQDEKIGALIAEAMSKVGRDGVLTVAEGSGLEITYEHKEGMQVNRGFISPYFVTDPSKMTCELDNPRFLVTTERVEYPNELMPLMEACAKAKTPLVIIADDVAGGAIQLLVANKLRGVVKTLAVKAPGITDSKVSALEDIAALTGATLINPSTGKSIKNVTAEDLGSADRVISDQDTTLIVGGKGDITEKVESLRQQAIDTKLPREKERIVKRLARLTGGVAVISVGGATESELKEKYLRVEDAVNATKAAVEAGVVVGGGVTLFRAREILNQVDMKDDYGRKMLYKALEKPVRKIVENAGLDAGEVIGKMKESKDFNVGFNVMTMQYEDLMKAGVVDPAKVTLSALRNAVSVAVSVMTTECLIADIPEKEDRNYQEPNPIV